MDATPNTVNYMVSGYIIFGAVMVSYLISLYSRWRSLKNEQQMLDDMQK